MAVGPLGPCGETFAGPLTFAASSVPGVGWHLGVE